MIRPAWYGVTDFENFERAGFAVLADFHLDVMDTTFVLKAFTSKSASILDQPMKF